MQQGVLFGATHDRGDDGQDLRPADHVRNLATLAQAMPELAERLAGAELQGRASLRAAAPDRMPLAGPIPDAPWGLHVLSGLGSRGFTLAPLLADHVAAQILGSPSPLSDAMHAEVDPDRFARRARRREGRGG
jgi:tRNA 5-methylaminomethyl-2-thiouridine biosynthesis bifunctional protein